MWILFYSGFGLDRFHYIYKTLFQICIHNYFYGMYDELSEFLWSYSGMQSTPSSDGNISPTPKASLSKEPSCL